MIDFDKLVLEPSQNVLAIPILVLPYVSQPGGSAYSARAIWSQRPVVEQGNGTILSTQTPFISVRHAEFVVQLKMHDHVILTPPYAGAQTTEYDVFGIDDDGQGAAKIELRDVSQLDAENVVIGSREIAM